MNFLFFISGLKGFEVVGHYLVPQNGAIRNRHGSGGQTLEQAVQTTEVILKYF